MRVRTKLGLILALFALVVFSIAVPVIQVPNPCIDNSICFVNHYESITYYFWGFGAQSWDGLGIYQFS